MTLNIVQPFFEPGERITGHTTTAVLAGRLARLQGRQAGGSPGLSANGNGGNYLTTYPVAGAAADGIYLSDAPINSKNTVLTSGGGAVVPVVTGAVVADGVEVQAGANGTVITWDGTLPSVKVGKAIVGAASGGTAEVKLY